MEIALVVVVVAFALGFDYTNGFHDAANAIATSVSTRALTPRVALIMAAVFNLIGALLGTEVATTIGSGIIEISGDSGTHGLTIVLASIDEKLNEKSYIVPGLGDAGDRLYGVVG